MEITEFKKEKIYILGLRGKLDAISSPAFREKFFSLIGDNERKFLIDCSNLDYISSAGIRVLFEASFKLEDLSGKLIFCSLSENVRKIFDMVDLSSEFPVYPSQKEAFAGFDM